MTLCLFLYIFVCFCICMFFVFVFLFVFLFFCRFWGGGFLGGKSFTDIENINSLNQFCHSIIHSSKYIVLN